VSASVDGFQVHFKRTNTGKFFLEIKEILLHWIVVGKVFEKRRINGNPRN